MAKRQITNVTFSKTNGTVTFNDFTSIDLQRVLAVINTTRGVVIYSPAGPTGTAATNVLTLTYNTSSHADADKLMVLYDLPDELVKHVSATGTLVANTVTTQTLTVSGFQAVEIEVTNVDGAGRIYITLDSSTPTVSNFVAMLPATPSSVVLPVGATATLKLWSYNSATPTWAAVVRGTT